jgi:hypothetical protein
MADMPFDCFFRHPDIEEPYQNKKDRDEAYHLNEEVLETGINANSRVKPQEMGCD